MLAKDSLTKRFMANNLIKGKMKRKIKKIALLDEKLISKFELKDPSTMTEEELMNEIKKIFDEEFDKVFGHLKSKF